jgi:hypothetical protein
VGTTQCGAKGDHRDSERLDVKTRKSQLVVVGGDAVFASLDAVIECLYLMVRQQCSTGLAKQKALQ